MRANSGPATKMINLRFGEFMGVGNTLGLIPALAPPPKDEARPASRGRAQPPPTHC